MDGSVNLMIRTTASQGLNTMKAMILRGYGEEAVFEAAAVDKPQVGPGEVLVRIAASSVNTVDTMIRRMGPELPLSPPLPAVLGMDFAGTVEAVGDGVTAFSVSEEVYGCAGGLADLPGTLAEFIAADQRLIARKPANLSMREAAALPLVSLFSPRPFLTCSGSLVFVSLYAILR